MSKVELLEGNKLIAEFMGLFPNPYDNGRTYGTNPVTIDGTVYADAWLFVEYHSSWDWLMPVVEKIENIDYGLPYWITISGVQCLIEEMINPHTDERETISDVTSDYSHSKINNVWQAVVQFIKWYNSQTNNQ